MEHLFSAPISELEIQIGKLAPYFGLGAIDTAICAGVSAGWFHVPFRGSSTVFFGCSMFFLMVVLSLGYFISVTAKSQLGACQMALLATFLPTFLLSGFIFPIDQMPVVVQWIYGAPVAITFRFFAISSPQRHSFFAVAPQIAALGIIGVIFVARATRSFQKRLP